MRYIVLILLTHLGFNLCAQHKCATMERTQQRAAAEESYAKGLEANRQLAESFEAGIYGADRSIKQVDLAVVVHVLYREESDNISMEQIHSQIDVLNRDFNWEQNDKGLIPEIWRESGETSGFRFHLADKDPDGNFTTGVTRKQTTVSDIGGGEDYYRAEWGGIEPWPQPHYINIWVCEIGGNVLGFTYLPSVSAQPSDGIVMDPRAFGTTGTAVHPYNGGRTLVHEMGHYFGLRHLWGQEEGDCTNTDYMADTPWQREANFGCNDFPHVSCPSEPDGDMFMNFMDYADDECGLLFTKNQIEFMQLVLQTAKVTLLHSPAITGITEPDDLGLTIYPNPAEEKINALFDSRYKGKKFGVYNALGQEVRTGSVSSSVESVDLSNLSKGVYFLKIESDFVRIQKQ